MSLAARSAPLVSVCLCTYRRSHVEQTLTSLLRQTGVALEQVEVIVVDNDATRYAEPLVSEIAAKAAADIKYLVEPARSISAARNTALRAAKGRWLAFIDDDEVAEPTWLAELLRAAAEYDADIVMGLVASALPPDAPWWAESGVFERPMPNRGRHLPFGRCGNALLRADLQRRFEVEFSEEYGATGGEDTHFFRAFQQKGIPLISCPEAVVTEAVLPDRISIGYLVRRAVRAGENHARITGRGRGGLRAAWGVSTAAAKFSIMAMGALASMPVSRNASLRLALRAIQQVGTIRSFFRRNPTTRD